MFFLVKDFLLRNNKFTEEWNPLNVLTSNAATVGSLDLDIRKDDKQRDKHKMQK